MIEIGGLWCRSVWVFDVLVFGSRCHQSSCIPRSLPLQFDQLDTARNPFHTAIRRGCDAHKPAGSHLYESCILSLFVKRNSQSRLLGLFETRARYPKI
jgi:hypothetical protein